MSAYVVGKDLIDLLVSAGTMYGPDSIRYVYVGEERVDIDDKDGLGQKLWNENYVSVNHRYNDAEVAPTYTFQPVYETVSAVAMLKALNCYEYQSSEHPGWETSVARAYVQRLQGKLIRALPGYDDASWEWERSQPVGSIVSIMDMINHKK